MSDEDGHSARAPTSGAAGPLVAALLSLSIVLVVATVRTSTVGAVVSLPLLGLVPGYAILAALRTEWSANDPSAPPDGVFRSPHRVIATAIGVSLLVVSAVGLALAVLDTFALQPFGTSLPALVAVVGAGTAGLSGVTAVRRYRRSSEVTVRPSPRVADGSGVHRGTLAIAVLTGLLVVTVGAIGIAPAADGFTEFYLLDPGPDGPTIADDPSLQPGVPASFVVGIENHEHRTVNYTVVVQRQEVRLGDDETAVTERRELAEYQLRIAHDRSRRFTHEFVPSSGADRMRVVYLLYRGEPPETPSRDTAYRSLAVWEDPDPVAPLPVGYP